MVAYFHLHWCWWAVLGCTGLYWTVLVFTKLNWAVVGCSRLYCGVLGFSGQSQQLFVCVFSHFRHGDERTTEQPGDPSASLLLTSVRRQSFAKRTSPHLQVASGSAIELTFTDIDIEPHGSCDYDYVQVLISYNLVRLVLT